MTKTLEAVIEMQATPERVWNVLTDFSAYPAWNPFIRRIAGEARAGARLEVFIQPAGGRGMTFRPTVLVAHPGRELRWRGRLLLPGLLDGEHVFEIVPGQDGRTRFVQREMFRGLLVPLFARTLERGTLMGFRAMNTELRARVEGKST
jgi:hypothetical protein